MCTLLFIFAINFGAQTDRDFSRFPPFYRVFGWRAVRRRPSAKNNQILLLNYFSITSRGVISFEIDVLPTNALYTLRGT